MKKIRLLYMKYNYSISPGTLIYFTGYFPEVTYRLDGLVSKFDFYTSII